jgi:hypothetical protein
MMSIIQAIRDKRVFGGLPIFKTLDTVGEWIVLLKAMDGLPLDDAEFEILKRRSGRMTRPTGAFSLILILAGRRAGKSFFSALKLVHAAVFKKWPPFLGKAYLLCLAADKLQASVVHGYVRDILREPAFKGMVLKETAEEIQLRNGIVISIHTSSFRTLRGLKILGCVADEISFWMDSETSRNPANEVIAALEPALGEVPGSQLLLPTTPYIRSGPVFELFRDYYGQDDDSVLVWKSSTTDLNSTYRQDVIDRAMLKDPSKARTEYYAEFRDDLETFVSLELISRAVVPGRVSVPYDARFVYHAFCDPSELVKSGDSMTFCISHYAAGKAVVDRLVEVRPPSDPTAVVEQFTAICREYHVGVIVEDKVSIGWISSAFSKNNITIEPCALTKSDLYSYLAVKLQGELLEIPDDERLCDQLLGLEKRNLSGGTCRIDHAPGGHDDVANAVAGGCWLACEYGAQGGMYLGLIGDVMPDGPGCREDFFPVSGVYGQ